VANQGYMWLSVGEIGGKRGRWEAEQGDGYYYGKKLDNEVDGMLFKAVGGC
jgi:hypothetical protein